MFRVWGLGVYLPVRVWLCWALGLGGVQGLGAWGVFAG